MTTSVLKTQTVIITSDIIPCSMFHNNCIMPTLNQPLQNRLCACSKTGFVPTLNQPLQNRLCACSKTSFVSSLSLLHQNRLCPYAQSAAPKPALHPHLICLFILNRYFDCLRGKVWLSGFGFSSPYRGFNIEYWPVLGQIHFCSFDRRCKTCLDTKPVLYQGRFCSLTHVHE